MPQPVARRLVSKADYSGDSYEVAGYDLRPGSSPEDIRAALALVEAACKAPPGAVIVQELARVFAVTKSRANDEGDEELSYVTMADGLIDFPIDVIRESCRAYAKWEKWRPSLSEIRDYCWRRFRVRASLRAELRKAAQPYALIEQCHCASYLRVSGAVHCEGLQAGHERGGVSDQTR